MDYKPEFRKRFYNTFSLPIEVVEWKNTKEQD